MDFGNMLGDSFEYTKEALMEKWVKWILLIIPFMTHGYALEIFKATKPAPEINDWVANFINGIKLFIIAIVYFIPVIIIGVIAVLPVVGAAITGDSSAIAAAGLLFLVGMLVCVLLTILIYLIIPFALIRFARTESFGEAFNFGAVLASIGKVGWISYIIALIVLFIAAIVFSIVIGIVMTILMFIPILGWLLMLIIELLLIPPVGIFCARYFTQIYDSAA
ncbi:MAG: hypothetical protein CVV32_10580 [Methanomicrobiales archaeon HGW-Methanomicrobiales-3]|jgi:hypothetical protein|nr:MAG: hypothetical protein CVV32_10580 [Methanomicrobiales archaeon HGW-Methanomicrobiales-3]